MLVRLIPTSVRRWTLSWVSLRPTTTLFRYFEMDIERPDISNVEAWYARLRQRPAYQEHVMLPFEVLFGQLAY